jgi:hypothetical protein
VAGAFDVPFGYFAFDQSRVRAGSARWVESGEDSGSGPVPPAVQMHEWLGKGPWRAMVVRTVPECRTVPEWR